eukprot:gene8054-16512_t
MESFANIPEYQKAEFMRYLEDEQMKESLKMYNRLVEGCFSKCVTTFRSKQLDEKENKCVAQCSEKFMKLTQRVGLRFAEYQALKAQPPK